MYLDVTEQLALGMYCVQLKRLTSKSDKSFLAGVSASAVVVSTPEMDNYVHHKMCDNYYGDQISLKFVKKSQIINMRVIHLFSQLSLNPRFAFSASSKK